MGKKKDKRKEKKAKEKAQPEKQELQSKSFDATLPSGQKVKVTLSQTEETIERRVKVQDGVEMVGTYPVPKYRNVRDKNGAFITAPVTVRGTRVRIRFDEDGETVETRSCCKPPDVFRVKEGFKRALRRLFQADSGILPNKYESGGKKTRIKVKSRLPGKDKAALLKLVMNNGKEKKVKE